jgi:hypothetical protein
MKNLEALNFLMLIQRRADPAEIALFLRSVSSHGMDYPAVLAQFFDPTSTTEFTLKIERRKTGRDRATSRQIKLGEAVDLLYNDGNNGISLEKSVAIISEKLGASEDHVRRCYYQYKKAWEEHSAG